MRKGMHKWLLGMMLMSSFPANAEIWVKDFNGQPEQYRLQRNDRNLEIRHYLVLNNGDRIWVEKGHALQLESGDGKVVAVTPANSPYRVQDTGKAPGILTNLVSWAGDWFKTKVEDGTAQPVVSLVTRSEIAPITLPLMPEKPVQLVSGSRPLHLVWEGGDPPFRVQLMDQEKKTAVFDQQGINESLYASPPVSLIPGSYRLSIADHDRRIDIDLEVLTSNDLPKPPLELSASAGADSARETIYALWLSAQGKQWMLEAYQRAALWQKEYLPARWLMNSLEKGVRPEPPAHEQGS
ncbi:MAG: hypothetical protein ACU841_15580 [Gammaproteobacteria bacterium]